MDAPRVVFEPDEPVQALLSELRRAIAQHPVATQAAFSALVAEGREFAKTSEGAAWRERLARSEWVERLQVVWDIVSMTSFVEKPTDSLPSAFVDGMARAASHTALERVLSRIFEQSAE